MTGAEHYRAAETYLQTIEKAFSERRSVNVADLNATIAVAQVHATLALAAASAQNIRRNGALAFLPTGWESALGDGGDDRD